ncbi:hypothetical protein L1049_028321 [Liquidambar formosana]|uniref:Exocyst subunit Exo70 family protein n=1 Tax=Liquidambar formosana TaxID=63359 RepID=A0AAP0RJH3_LIQFO
MGDCKSIIPTYEGEQHMIAAAQHIVKALGASRSVTDDMRRILADLETHLSTMTILSESDGEKCSELEERLKCAEKKVMSWESNQSIIWDSDPGEAAEYLQVVDEIRSLTEDVGSSSLGLNGKQKELLHRANVVLQMAMVRLEEELIHILVHKKQSFELENISFRSCREDIVYEESFVSVQDELVEETSQRDSSGNVSEYSIDLVHPDVIPYLKSIADVMFASNYGQEFCQAFITTRKDALDEYLVILEMEKLSIQDVLKLEWSSLNSEIRKWIRAMKIIIGAYLIGEKRLCNQILGVSVSVNSLCFTEISKALMLRFLNFGIAVALGPHQPEKLFRLLDMYEVLADLLIDIDTLFSEEAGSFVRTEFHELLRSLGDSARATFMEFENAVASNASTNPFPGGGIHHLTRYVMNYIKTLTDYADTLNLLLEDQDGKDLDPIVGLENEQDISSVIFCPMARRLRSVTSILEFNLDCKSKLYKDGSLQQIFLMNNLHYMVQKVKDSELVVFFGDEWIRKCIGKFQHHATSYVRPTWSSVLSLLMDDGKSGSSSGSVSKTNLKERCRRFSVAFEEVYKSQTGWLIPDPQLREDLRISTSQKLIPAYRTFCGRVSNQIGDKYIKYTADDLGNYLLDLFDGSPRSLRNFRRR